MRKIQLGTSNLYVPPIAVGCMGMGKLDHADAEKMIHQALDLGINFFDHADIYGQGRAEEVFGNVLQQSPHLREQMIIQTKAGIRQGYYDFSKEHIVRTVDQSLQRLQTDYVDVFLLHRPDALMEPDEVAEAFAYLHNSGKVRHFGVSNHKPYQIELLKQAVKQQLVANQLQLSIMHTGMIDSGIQVNTRLDNAFDRDGHVLDYCRLHQITIQAWSPFRYGMFEGFFLDNDQFPQLNETIQTMARKYEVDPSAIAVAWILRHPAKMQTLVGTTKPARLLQIAQAAEIKLTRPDWYELYRSAGNHLP